MSEIINIANFGDMVTMVSNLVNNTTLSDQDKSNIKTAINYSYTIDLSKLEKKISSATLTVSSGIATLPSDLLSIERISPELLQGDTIIGDSIITALTSDITLTYAVIRNPLSADSDIPQISKKWWLPMVWYGAYAYYIYKKKFDEAVSFYNNYEKAKQELAVKDHTEKTIKSGYTKYLKTEKLF